MKKQSLIKGSLILALAGILAKFLGLFFRWPLIMLIGDEGIGYYQMSYPLYMFFVAMASGVPVTVSKLIAENNAVNNIKKNFEVIKETMVLMICLGAGTSFILFFFSKQIINFLNWDNKSYYSLIGVSFAPVIISMVMVFRGFFQGFQNMTYPAASQVLEQLGRVFFGVGLAVLFFSKGIEYSAGGAAFGAAGGGIISLIYLFSKYKKTKKFYGIKKVKFNSELLNKILRISIPISMGATACTIMSLLDSILVPSGLISAGFESKEATILYAQLTGKASVIINIPLTLSVAICTSLLPQIAEEFILKRKKILFNKINMSFKMSQVIALPCTLGLFFMAKPIMNFIFPGRFEGFEILKILSIAIPFIVITQVTTSILQGTNSFIAPVINLTFGCFIKMVLTIALVKNSEINIYGAVIATICAYIVVAVLNIIWMKIKINVKINAWINVVKPSIASAFMIVCVCKSYSFMGSFVGDGIRLLISVFIGAIIYVLMLILLGIFSLDELKISSNR